MSIAGTLPPPVIGRGRGFAILIAAVAALMCSFGLAHAALTFPPLTGRVVDSAHVLSADAQQQLTSELADLETKTGRQVVVVTLPSLQGDAIEDYGYQLGRAWGIGQKGQNNGALFIVAPSEHKVRVEVGYGLEPVLTDVIKARASATQVVLDPTKLSDPAAVQRYQAAQNSVAGALGRLMVVSEKYPDLKSNENFLALQSQLEGTENRIAVARRDYNEAVRDYNTTLRVFPTVLWAKSFYSSAQRMEPFAATTTAQSAPTVGFNLGYASSAPAAK